MTFYMTQEMTRAFEYHSAHNATTHTAFHKQSIFTASILACILLSPLLALSILVLQAL